MAILGRGGKSQEQPGLNYSLESFSQKIEYL